MKPSSPIFDNITLFVLEAYKGHEVELLVNGGQNGAQKWEGKVTEVKPSGITIDTLIGPDGKAAKLHEINTITFEKQRIKEMYFEGDRVYPAPSNDIL